MWEGVIWYGGPAGRAAVLYSVVVGAVREFWVKTAGADAKVHEIPAGIGGSGGGGSTGGGSGGGSGGTDNGLSDASYIIEYAVNTTVNGGIRYQAFRGPISGFRIRREPEGAVWYEFLCWGALDRVFNPDCVNVARITGNGPFWLSLVSFAATSVVSIKKCPEGIPVDPALIPGLVEEGFYTPPGPLEPNPYEALVSAFESKIFTLTKSNLNDEDEEFGELKYQSLVDGTVADLGTTPDPQDWRGEAVSLTPTAQIEGLQPCADAYLASDNALLLDDNLYTIDLGQTIDGQTLRSRLQTSTATIAATLTTRTATNAGASCTLGTPAESTVQVPSPGRGTVEGITYLP